MLVTRRVGIARCLVNGRPLPSVPLRRPNRPASRWIIFCGSGVVAWAEPMWLFGNDHLAVRCAFTHACMTAKVQISLFHWTSTRSWNQFVFIGQLFFESLVQLLFHSGVWWCGSLWWIAKYFLGCGVEKSPSFPPGDPPNSYFVVPYHFPWWFQVLVPSIFLGVSWGSPAPELWDIPAPVLSSSNLWPALGKPEPSLRDSWKIALCEMSWKSCPIWFEVEHTHNFLIGS